MLHPHHFAALERQMIFWGYILHFFIYLVFSLILDVVVRVVIRPAFSSLITTRTSSAFCEGREGPSLGAMVAAMLSNQFREEKKIDTLLQVDGYFS
jgi:hypothetical protein